MNTDFAYLLQVPAAAHLRGTFYISGGECGLRRSRRRQPGTAPCFRFPFLHALRIPGAVAKRTAHMVCHDFAK
jgi:hypothetical protein